MPRIKIEGMSCQHCVKSVTQALNSLPGVSGVRVSLEDREAVFESTEEVDMELVRKAVEDAGYRVTS